MKIPLSRTFKELFPELFFSSDGWDFSKTRMRMYVSDYQEWLANYLPISVEGLRVLDVGAGEGETARFYLEHGASKVLCIEPYIPAFEKLQKNARRKRIICFQKKFTLSDLQMPFDFMKMDIEGYEEALLGAELTKPAVVEIHGLQLADKFRQEGWTIKIPDHHGACCLSYAFKNIK